jgi:3-hydroxypropanoate dehydrogenase
VAATVNDAALDLIFRNARSYNSWLKQPVSPALLQAVYELMAAGPTSMNSCPARILWLVSQESKQRLKSHLAPDNVEKSLTAPAVAVIGYDLAFYDQMPRLFPDKTDARDMFKASPALETFAFRNATLQGGYFILAARALGLDCGPMSGFNNEGVDSEFFAGTRVKSNFLCAVGHGDPATLPARNIRLAFDDACKVL